MNVDTFLRAMKDPSAFLAHKTAEQVRTRDSRNAAARKFARKKLGIPEAPYPAPLECECCGREKSLQIDHDHATGEFRGWLCMTCNTAIGKLGDNINGVKRAMAYLVR